MQREIIFYITVSINHTRAILPANGTGVIVSMWVIFFI